MDLFKSSRSGELSGKIKAASGKVILIISPDDINLGSRFHSVFEKVLRQTRTPVIILESRQHISELKKSLTQAGLPLPTILPTGPESPFLAKKNFFFHSSDFDTTQKDLAEMLRKLGATNVLLGGTHAISYSAAVENGEPKEVPGKYKAVLKSESKLRKNAELDAHDESHLITHGCVGVTYKNLISHGLNVRLISPITWPFKPQYWRKLNAMPKQKFERNLKKLKEKRKSVHPK